MLVSHLIFSLILAIYAHILGTHAGLSSHFSLILAIYAHILGTHAGLSSHFTLETSILAHFLHILAGFHFLHFGQIGLVSHLMSSLRAHVEVKTLIGKHDQFGQKKCKKIKSS